MWDYGGYIAKAKLYNARSESYSDDGFALWLLLGLEFLLRAPLAKIHPSMLAEPTGDSILHANGIAVAGVPKSVATSTVLKRLEIVIPGFGAVMAQAALLVNLRNGELHSASTELHDIRTSAWLGDYYEVVTVICQHLDMTVADVLPESVADQAREYAAENRAKIKHDVEDLMRTAATVFAGLLPEQVKERQVTLSVRALTIFGELTFTDCPVCQSQAALDTSVVRVARDRYDEDEDVIERDVVSLVKGMLCVVCELRLSGVHAMEAAGLPSEHLETVTQTYADRYGDQFHEPDYGND